MATAATAIVDGMDAAPLSPEAAAFLRRQVETPEALAAENEALRRRVADLTGALTARDMEIAALRERCQRLMQSIAQQDETIAKIYAVAAAEQVAPTPKSLPTQPVSPPLPPAGPPVGKLITKKKSVSLAVTATAGAAGSVLSEAIERILHSPSPPPPSSSTSSCAPATAPPTSRHRRMSLFDDDASSATTDDTSPSSCSSTLSKSSSGRHFERRESCASEEDFVKSAGFLRKPSRRSSGRLSISDFGLLDDDEVDEQDEVEDMDNQRADEAGDGNVGDKEKRAAALGGRPTSEDLQLKRSRSAGSSQRNLFADIDAAKIKAKSKATKNNQDEAEDDEQEMTYAEFLERLRLPASRDILETIRLFLASILGPRGDGKPPRSTDFVDYEFYGNHEFRRRCVYFFQSMEELLLNHPLWRHASETTLSKARDGIEKYVMDKLQDIAMNQLDECVEWKQEDERLLQRMKLLSFITPDMLDIKPCMRNEVVWSMAEDELRRINSFRSPGDKINCIVRCCSIIFSVLNLTRGDAGSRPGADDFLPVFIYIVLHSKIPRLHSNCEYIAAYRNPNDLMSKAGYCFVNLRSAVEFLSVVDASMLSVAEDDFTRLYAREEQKLLANSD